MNSIVMFFKTTVLLSFILRCAPELSIFLLGDSTSGFLYHDGFIPTFNCYVVDPNITQRVERSPRFSWGNGYLCNKYGITRVGYAVHWGVFSSHYHKRWNRHQSFNSSLNSRTNIIDAVVEFQTRTKNSKGPVIFLFLSSLWDIKRYEEHPDLYSSKNKFLTEFQNKYTSLMLSILDILRANDVIVIETMHGVPLLYPDFIPELNDRARRVARYLRIPVLDIYKFLGSNSQEYLFDEMHQNNISSLLITKNILAKNWTILPTGDCLI